MQLTSETERQRKRERERESSRTTGSLSRYSTSYRKTTELRGTMLRFNCSPLTMNLQQTSLKTVLVSKTKKNTRNGLSGVSGYCNGLVSLPRRSSSRDTLGWKRTIYSKKNSTAVVVNETTLQPTGLGVHGMTYTHFEDLNEIQQSKRFNSLTPTVAIRVQL